ncbi:hypothetical protein MC885_012384 [Smutsia gigantea]|nr:hypothetical protein MC885_012384 [Smutsia gigantea]
MAYEKAAEMFDISRSMFRYPWLEYPKRTKGARGRASPKPGELEAAPEQARLGTLLHLEKPEVYSHWQTLYNRQQEREAQKMLRKMGDAPRCALPSRFPTPSSTEKKEGGVGYEVGSRPSRPREDPGGEETPLSPSGRISEDQGQRRIPPGGRPSRTLYLPTSKLARKAQMGSKPLDPAGNPLKWQRQELPKSLKSPTEDEQLHAAQALGCLGVGDKFIMKALWQVHVIRALIKRLKGQNEGQRMDRYSDGAMNGSQLLGCCP